MNSKLLLFACNMVYYKNSFNSKYNENIIFSNSQQ